MCAEAKLETIGEISRETDTVASFAWKVRDLFDLPEEVDHCVKSPTFRFLDAEWCLRMFPNGQTKHNSFGWVGMYVRKLYSVTLAHLVSYHLYIRKVDDKEYASFSAEQTFQGNDTGWGIPKFVKRSTLLRDKNVVAPQDGVIFLCVLHAKANKRKQSASQTLQVEGVESLSHDLKALFLTGEQSDVLFKVKNQDFKAHRAVLGARSSVFKAMFGNDMLENSCGIIDIPDCDPFAFRESLLYLYCGYMNEFPPSKAFDLYYVADKYDVQEVKTKCLEILKDNVSMDTFYGILTLALQHNESTLLNSATDFFIENEADIIVTVEWLSFLKENPIEANELHIKSIRSKMHK